MNLLSAVCVILFAGMVSSHETPCRRYTGGWYYTVIHLQPDPNAQVPRFGFNCYWWRPSWSQCRGNCGDSSTTMWINPWPPRYRDDCDCCRADRSDVYRPCVWCQWVFTGPFICPVPPPPPGWICSHPDTEYGLVGACDCRTCRTSPFGGRKRRDADEGEDVDPLSGLPRVRGDESDIRDRPRPPPPVRRARNDYNQYLEQIPEEYRRCEAEPQS